jgi:alpha-L-fucosidase
MGPHRDIVGELSAAVRKRGLRYGVSNHGVENFTFVNPTPDIRARLEAAGADLFDPAWAAFYNVADRSDAAQTRFLTDWVNRNLELIDKYQPDLLWFDNGANLRLLDPLKLHIAAYYYNRALEWHKEVSLATKFNAYAPSNDDTRQIGSIVDFEKVGARSPAGIRPGPWMVDDPIGGNSWSYIDGLRLAGADAIIGRLIDTVSKGGFYLFNISPMADGSIPPDQQEVLLKIGAWLDTNGEAIYGTRPWTRCLETGPQGPPGYHFTTRGGALYAIASAWPAGDAVVASLAAGSPAGKAAAVTLLGHPGALEFTQDERGLRIKLPAQPSGGPAWVFKIEGLTLP